MIGRAIEMLYQTDAPRILYVNLCGMTISDPELVTALPARIARESGDPSRLAFEITETAAIEIIDTTTNLDELTQLAATIDDIKERSPATFRSSGGHPTIY